MKNILILILSSFIFGCASKTLVKKCIPTIDEQYFVCETVIFK